MQVEESRKLAPGTTVAERYQVLSVLGEGGMGQVALVLQSVTQKLGAMKLLTAMAPEIIERFNRESGLLGVSGLSKDINDLIGSDSPDARFAVELYCYRVRKYIGAYLAVLSGCDAILFGGGVGEHIPQVRQAILEGFAWTGIEIDSARNERATGSEANISSAQSKISVHVIPVDEERVLARAALSAVGAKRN